MTKAVNSSLSFMTEPFSFLMTLQNLYPNAIITITEHISMNVIKKTTNVETVIVTSIFLKMYNQVKRKKAPF